MKHDQEFEIKEDVKETQQSQGNARQLYTLSETLQLLIFFFNVFLCSQASFIPPYWDGGRLMAPIFQTQRVGPGGPMTRPSQRAEKGRASLFLSVTPSVGGNTSWTSISRRGSLKGKVM